ncbi:MAG: class I SAM-dependent methyltransferase, partial [Candidatus Obscuribacterales bacterium]|nr:class I SAM-dependent methyltransferase [Candidatus Obscuribacterales bacterium]
EGDVENMPYEVSTFDVAVSMFGAMFAPRPQLVVSELLRVTRNGGIIAMANWTPTSFIGEIFKTIGSFVSPPSIMPSPLLWGDENVIRERFGSQVREIGARRRLIAFEFDLEPGDVVSFWRQYYGPTQRAFDALQEKPELQTKLHQELELLWNNSNKAKGGRTVVESEYLEVVVSR